MIDYFRKYQKIMVLKKRQKKSELKINSLLFISTI